MAFSVAHPVLAAVDALRMQRTSLRQQRGCRRRAAGITQIRAGGRFYGISSEDGSWFPEKTDTFQTMIRAAKGVRDVLQAGTPVLREAAKPIKEEDIGTPQIQELIEEMTNVMLVRGVGLAAPQIGVSLQLIVLADTEEGIQDLLPGEAEAQGRRPFKLKVIINPVVEKKPGGGYAHFFEGCLSVQGYRALVERALEVDVRGLGGDGKPVRFSASGWQARILQHEFDHLQGTLYTDRMVPRTLRRVDLVREPLPPPSAEFGACPPLGPSSGKAGGASGKGFGGAASKPLVSREQGGAKGKKK